LTRRPFHENLNQFVASRAGSGRMVKFDLSAV
jgi:hypothetical protein